jgi:hypothetical protein
MLPIGHRISNPKGLLLLDISLSKKFTKIIHTKKSEIFFTRISLKHIAEKQKNPEAALDKIYKTIQHPDLIYKAERSRFLFSKSFFKEDGLYSHTLALEVLDKNIIVTAFNAKQKYLKNFEILWKSASLRGSSIST